MDKETRQVYLQIMQEIIEKTQGNYEKMIPSERIMMITIMKELKRDLDLYYKRNYAVIKSWAELSILDVLEDCSCKRKRGF
ncbi:hypothetical protein AAK964_12295 [Tissierella praeacuta]|uniref:hypothetical protein n=1 Tax=Tissierella praeacuta TaxID=43131 RepID=UPI0035146F6E